MEDKYFEFIKLDEVKKKIITKLTENSKKGDNGCLATIGGSLEYTGAPFYSAISALKAGSDLSHVFCHTEAALPIKSYSPELIVHPGFNLFSNTELVNKSIRWFKSMDSILIGPGLGREPDTEKIFVSFSKSIAQLQNIPLVYDADGVWFWSKINKEKKYSKETIELINLNKYLILTPNFKEFCKLCDLLGEDFNGNSIEEQIKFIDDTFSLNGGTNQEKEIIKINDIKNNNRYHNIFLNEINLCDKFNNNFILVKKGKCDIITDGLELFIIKNKGSLKRTGGIGDILSGLINCYCGMISKKKKDNKTDNSTEPLLNHKDLMACCIFACFICREASRIGYEKMSYSLTAPDIINEISTTVKKFYK